MSDDPQYLTRLAAEIDEALERSDEIAELQDTRVLAAAYRAEKARAERAAAESCRIMSDRLERLVEANIKLREALERIVEPWVDPHADPHAFDTLQGYARDALLRAKGDES